MQLLNVHKILVETLLSPSPSPSLSFSPSPSPSPSPPPHLTGIMLHYATPALSHLYFVDPQWLCDMLAHVVTVPEVNSFIPRKDGNMYCT